MLHLIKPTFLLVAAIILPLMLKAQDVVQVTLPWNKEQKIGLELEFVNDVTIEGWDKDEVSVKFNVDINNGTMNHAHVVDTVVMPNRLTIISQLDREVLRQSNQPDCYGQKGTKFNFGDDDRGSHRICSTVSCIVYLPARADLKVKSINGNLTITGMTGSVKANTVNGSIELAVSPRIDADVELKSVMGKVESNPPLETERDDNLRPLLTRKLNGKLNKGGKILSLESVTGNVSLKSTGRQ